MDDDVYGGVVELVEATICFLMLSCNFFVKQQRKMCSGSFFRGFLAGPHCPHYHYTVYFLVLKQALF